MIQEAVQLRASDIHVEPFEDRVRIRYRIDGVCVERDSPPKRLLAAIVSRIKILAKMDIAETRRPTGRPHQDHRRRQRSWTCGSASSRPTTASRSSCDCWTRTTSRSASASWGSRNDDFKQLQLTDQTPQRHHPGHRPDGLAARRRRSTPRSMPSIGRTGRSSPPRTRSSTTCRASTRSRCGTTSGWTSPASSAPCCARPPTSSWSARCAITRLHRWESRHL